MNTVKLSPSMMCADFLHLETDLEIMASSGVEMLHIDIMDGHYVPNFTLGPDYCRALSEWGKIPLDIHLMIEGADTLAAPFLAFKGSYVTFHPETVYHPIRTLQMLKAGGVRPGIDIAPAFTIDQAAPLLPYVDMVCVMTVNPGYAGQKLIPEMLDKIAELKDIRQNLGLSFEIEVDGNVSWEHIPVMVEVGADILVAGTSSLFRKGEALADNINRFRKLVSDTQAAKG